MRIRARSPLVFFLVAGATYALAAQQPRDNRARTREGTATLSGRVVTRDGDGRPLRKTIVLLRSDDGRMQRTAITDDAGAFTFDALPAGRYGVDASRRGWPTIGYGAARPHQRGTRIEITDGQRIDDIVIRMPRGAVLTGSVVDQTGRPLAHVPIVALRYVFVNGERRPTRYREDRTDDRGVYRLYGLAAGEYLVATAGPPMAFDDPGPIYPTADLDVRRVADPIVRSGFTRMGAGPFGSAATVGFAPTYYPGTPFRAQALPVVVGPGEERGGLDFEVAPAQALRVEGFVDKPRGLSANVRVTLRSTSDDAYRGEDRQTFAGIDGTFAFPAVPPGAYELSARLAQDDATSLWASSAFTVSGEVGPRVMLTLRPALTISGRVFFDGEPRQDASAVRIALHLLTTGESFVADVDGSGNFTIAGLVPGRYRAAASVGSAGGSRGWSARSFLVNGVESLESIVDLRFGSAVAVVALTDRYGAVSGVVQNSAGRAAPERFVLMFPTDPRLWSSLSQRIHAVRPFADGRYLVEHLPPGEYFLAVVADVEEGEWFDRTVLQRLAGSASRIDVAEGQRQVRDLRVE